jgi:hypothetical protein
MTMSEATTTTHDIPQFGANIGISYGTVNALWGIAVFAPKMSAFFCDLSIFPRTRRKVSPRRCEKSRVGNRGRAGAL